jgi:signal transduction histidine kinase
MERETSPLVPLVRVMPHAAKYLIFAALVVQKQTIGFLAMSLSETSHVLDSQLSFINSVAFQTALACENARLFNSLKEQQLQLRRLSNEIINAQEEERKRLARELHDDIGQIFSAMKLHVETMQNTPASGIPDKSVDALTKLAKRGMEDLRHISLNLRPPMLDDLGLLSTLNWYSKDYSSRFNVSVNINNDGVNDRKYDTEFETNLFRIIQEALTNVAKHAEAQNVVIRLKERDTQLDVAIRDDGKGFKTGDLDDSDGHLHGFGMLNMKERAAMYGGKLHIKSKPGAGTEIKMSFLLRNISSTRDPNDST